jgi:hypothetical protein
MTDMTVPRTILEQLGGRMFTTMTGARNLVGAEDSLAIGLPVRFAKDGINKVRITLTAADDYTVEFFRFRPRRGDLMPVSRADGVYCDQLVAVFREHTGLEVSLGRDGLRPAVVGEDLGSFRRKAAPEDLVEHVVRVANPTAVRDHNRTLAFLSADSQPRVGDRLVLRDMDGAVLATAVVRRLKSVELGSTGMTVAGRAVMAGAALRDSFDEWDQDYANAFGVWNGGYMDMIEQVEEEIGITPTPNQGLLAVAAFWEPDDLDLHEDASPSP